MRLPAIAGVYCRPCSDQGSAPSTVSGTSARRGATGHAGNAQAYSQKSQASRNRRQGCHDARGAIRRHSHSPANGIDASISARSGPSSTKSTAGQPPKIHR